jgi:MFS family permease
LVVGGWWFVVGGKSILSERATNPTHSTHHQPPTTNRPWHRELTRDQWRAFAGAFLGWTFDGFDFTVLTFILIDIQRAFGVDAVLAGALGTVTLLMRLVGGVCAGAAADKWGRKTPLMLSILWFSLFAFLSAFSTSYAMLFAIRALFGIGMGGVWAAGMPLALEHWPAHLRGTASGMLQGGFAWGFILAALAFRFIYPAFQAMPDLGWRVMFGIGLLPALLVPWIHARVSESPIWLERREHLRATGRQETAPVIRLFQRALVGTTIQCAALMSAFMFSYYSIVFWYATLLRGRGIEPLVYLVTLNLGQALGNPVCGTHLGRIARTTRGRGRGCAARRRWRATVRAGDRSDRHVAGRRDRGRLRGRHLGDGADLPDRALPHRGPRRGTRLLRSLRRRRRIPDALGHRLHAGARHAARHGDGAAHRHLGPDRRGHHLAGTRNEGTGILCP